MVVYFTRPHWAYLSSDCLGGGRTNHSSSGGGTGNTTETMLTNWRSLDERNATETDHRWTSVDPGSNGTLNTRTTIVLSILTMSLEKRNCNTHLCSLSMTLYKTGQPKNPTALVWVNPLYKCMWLRHWVAQLDYVSKLPHCLIYSMFLSNATQWQLSWTLGNLLNKLRNFRLSINNSLVKMESHFHTNLWYWSKCRNSV